MHRVRRRLHVPRGIRHADPGVVRARHVPRLGVRPVFGLSGRQRVRGRRVSAEAVPALEESLPSLDFNPARVIYLFHLAQAQEKLGHRDAASMRYLEAAEAFPGTRLASEAKARQLALGAGGAPDGLFRGMLPEAPGASSQSIAVRRGAKEPDEDV